MHQREPHDAGFTLLEAVVAMVIFGIIAASTAAVLVRTVGGAGDNRARVAAANVASQTMDAVRNSAQSPTGYVALSTQTLTDVTVQGRPYHVYQSVTPVTGSNSGSPCTTGGITDQQYKKVSVEVSWDNSGNVAPVRTDTIIQNPGVSADPTKGALGVLVNGPTAPEPQVPVTLNNGTTVVTDDSGCAYFDGLTPGSFTATANAVGYVDDSGSSTSVKQATVLPATATTVYLAYAAAATPTLTFQTVLANGTVDSSYPWPSSWAYTLKTSAKDRSGTSTSGVVTPSPGLYPFSSGYSAWMGSAASCGNAPAAPVNFPTLEGTSSNVSVPVGGITVTNSRSSAITVTLSQGAGCATYSASVPARGQVKVALPFGSWSATTPVLLLLPTASSPSSVALSPSAPTGTLAF